VPILPGERLGPYEILSSIGAGGMGEIYRARDTRLDRIVVIKVLSSHLADKVELRERFEPEARVIRLEKAESSHRWPEVPIGDKACSS
jgi:eukaryotic-like serine/threonine-protein kinase